MELYRALIIIKSDININKILFTWQISASFEGRAQEKPLLRMKYFPRLVRLSKSSHWGEGITLTSTLCKIPFGTLPKKKVNI